MADFTPTYGNIIACGARQSAAQAAPGVTGDTRPRYTPQVPSDPVATLVTEETAHPVCGGGSIYGTLML
jgi:hypothetical protein